MLHQQAPASQLLVARRPGFSRGEAALVVRSGRDAEPSAGSTAAAKKEPLRVFEKPSPITEKPVQVLDGRYDVMDMTAFTLCQENGKPIFVVDFWSDDALVHAVQGKHDVGTLISG